MKGILSFCLILVVVQSSFALAKQLPTEFFTKPAEFGDVKLSPDGKYLAVTMPQEDGNALAIFDRKTFKPTYIYQFPTNSYVSKFLWANNERIVFTRKYKKQFDEQYFTEGQIYAGNFDGSQSEVIYGHSANHNSSASFNLRRKSGPERAFGSVLHSLPDDKNHIVISSRHMDNEYDDPVKILKLNIYDGRQKMLTRTPFGNMEIGLDGQGKPVFTSGVDSRGKSRKFFYTDREWQEIDSTSELYRFNFLSLDSTGDKLYMTAHLNGKTDAMYEYSFSSSEINMVFNHPVSDIHAYIREPDTQAIVGAEVMPDVFEYHYFDLKSAFAKIHDSLAKALPENDITITSLTRDQKEMIVLVRTDKNPGDFYLFNRDNNKLEYIFSRKEWLNPDALAARDPIKFTARDGQTIYGYLTKPLDTFAPVPLVTLVHGGPYGVSDTWFYDTDAQFLANRGFAVLQVNYRGSGGYGYKYESKAYKKRHSLIQQDIIDGTKWALSQEGINNKACIMGWSFGGYSALMSPLTEPDLFKCSIAAAGVYDVNMQLEEADYSKISSVAKGAVVKKYGKGEDLLKKESPLTYIDNLKTPIMIVHGGKDTRVPPEHAMLLRDALDERNLEYEWLFKKNEGHGFYNENNRIEFFDKSVIFLNKHLQ